MTSNSIGDVIFQFWKLSDYLKVSAHSVEESKKLSFWVRSHFPCYDEPHQNYLSLMVPHPNFSLEKEVFSLVPDDRKSWAEDRLVFSYPGRNNGKINEYRNKKIVIEEISKIPSDVTSESFWDDYIKRNNLGEEINDPEVDIFYYIGLAKLKFKRNVLRFINNQEELCIFLIDYSRSLLYFQYLCHNFRYFNNDQIEYTNCDESLETLKKYIINNLDLNKYRKTVLTFWEMGGPYFVD